ncbi:MAG: fibronectin type III domain-containing protein, partial [Actinobacteria bacterium]|nr:fibronectin type III domain-containing protein [Actinomycetota bacterium]
MSVWTNCCYYTGTVTSTGQGLPTGAAPRSAEVWFSGGGTLMGWGAGAARQSFYLSANGNQLCVDAWGDQKCFTTPGILAVTDGSWHHVVATYDGGTAVTMYLDGDVLGTANFAAPLATAASNLTVGQFTGGYNGRLDEVAVYPTALSAAAVKAHFDASGNSKPGPVTNLVVTPGANKVDVSWTAATAGIPSGQPQVARYFVTAYQGSTPRQSVAVDGTLNTISLTGLVGGVDYTVKVVATNPFGAGPPVTTAPFTPSGATGSYVGSVLGDAPSLYYRLGEPSGIVAADSSGNGHGGSLSGPIGFGSAGALANDADKAVSVWTNCCYYTGTVTSTGQGLPTGAAPRSAEVWFSG